MYTSHHVLVYDLSVEHETTLNPSACYPFPSTNRTENICIAAVTSSSCLFQWSLGPHPWPSPFPPPLPGRVSRWANYRLFNGGLYPSPAPFHWYWNIRWGQRDRSALLHAAWVLLYADLVVRDNSSRAIVQPVPSYDHKISE